MDHYGIVPASSTLYIPFTTHDTDGAAVAPSSAFEAADVRIYKNGSATQRSSEAGYTMTSPFDSVTGLHLLAVDLSDNTDAGFYAEGARYSVILVPDETVDGFAVVRVLADFSIGPPAVNVSQWLGTAAATPTVAGVPEVDITHLGGVAQSLTDLKDFADDGYDPSTNKVQGVVLTDTVTTYTGNTPQTGDSFARLGAPAGVSVSADIADVEGKVDDLESRIGTPSNLGGGATVAANLSDIEAQTDDIGTAGAGLTALGDTRLANLDATVSSRASQTSVDTIDDFLDTEIAAIKTVTDQFTAAQAEPSAAPAANATPLEKIAWLAALARNKITQTATTQTLRNDADSGNIATSTHSDDGTVHTRGEWA